jgi:tetratricopeptide (TPR) repeat protein
LYIAGLGCSPSFPGFALSFHLTNSLFMRSLLLTFALVISSFFAFSQSSIKDFVEEGIRYHDNGEFDKAIETYKKALQIDPKSALVHYEIALSYVSAKEYQKAIQHSDKVIKQNGEHIIPAYLTKGSALNMMGKTKQSSQVLEKGIKKTGGYYLMHYNLALNYYSFNDLDNAEKNLLSAIALNASHASSHLLLATIHHARRNSVQALLSAHYFLFLEPGTERSKQAYKILKANFGGNVTTDADKPNNINITLLLSNYSQFSAAELMLSMLAATSTIEKNKDKSEDELFVDNTGAFFRTMGELKKEEYTNIWWTLYTPFFSEIANSEHITTYCAYISQLGNENSKKWLSNNEAKLEEFSKWLETK